MILLLFFIVGLSVDEFNVALMIAETKTNAKDEELTSLFEFVMKTFFVDGFKRGQLGL